MPVPPASPATPATTPGPSLAAVPAASSPVVRREVVSTPVLARAAARRRARVAATAAVVAAAALTGCTGGDDDEAPGPLRVDVVGVTFPDAREAGVLEVLGEDLMTGYSEVMGSGGQFLVPGTSDGLTDDLLGLLDPATGETEWLVETDLDEGSYVVPGDVDDDWIVWTVETEAGATPDDAVPFVHAYERATGAVQVLADGTGPGGYAPAASGGRVLLRDGLAVWEGAVAVEEEVPEDGATSEGTAGGGSVEVEPEPGDGSGVDAELFDEDGFPVDEELFDDGLDLDGADDGVVDAVSVVFARALDGSGDVLTVASDAGDVARDECVGAVTVAVLEADDVVRRAVTAEGTLGDVLPAVATGDDEDVWQRCGATAVVETITADGTAVASVALRGEGREIVLVGDGVAELQVAGLGPVWAVVWVGDSDTGAGEQLLVHRPSGQVWSLGDSEAQLLVLRGDVVAFGGEVVDDVDLEEIPEEELSDEDASDGAAPDATVGDDATGEGSSGGGSKDAGDDEVVVEEGEVVVVDEDDLERELEESLDEGELEIVEDDDVVEEGDEDFWYGGASTTVARLVPPQG